MMAPTNIPAIVVLRNTNLIPPQSEQLLSEVHTMASRMGLRGLAQNMQRASAATRAGARGPGPSKPSGSQQKSRSYGTKQGQQKSTQGTRAIRGTRHMRSNMSTMPGVCSLAGVRGMSMLDMLLKQWDEFDDT